MAAVCRRGAPLAVRLRAVLETRSPTAGWVGPFWKPDLPPAPRPPRRPCPAQQRHLPSPPLLALSSPLL